ncbi:beta carbonic anhydrase 5, chloroplastic [Ananas comosus]|uniref:Carbonic anhydrase n=1 Tax=Ananas comosus TaxID=4615 RepID=A0A6P5F6M4_ANACO|nr:beta carbonic anhydrase 5, chloroplastic [Ananas comosus]
MASLLRSPLPCGLNLTASTSDHEAFAGFSASSVRALKISNSPLILRRPRNAYLRILRSNEKRVYVTEASEEPFGLSQEIIDSEQRFAERDTVLDPFKELEYRFLDFKRRNYVENLVNYQNLAQQQAPKFMVVACADSRVCPTSILGFQPGEAFTVRNVANLVPPFEHGASETNAALEFAVNSLEVPNILVIGHSRCGGIQALMSMKENAESRSFIRDWVSVGKSARLSTKAAAGGQSFEMQCRHCEKESINGSLLNLLTYPWIEKRVTEGALALHGGYYDFVNCNFEKWTLVYRKGLEGGSKYAIKDRCLWS